MGERQISLADRAYVGRFIKRKGGKERRRSASGDRNGRRGERDRERKRKKRKK